MERHAVVIGAGIGGLCAARALSDRFERVTVLDRDTLPDAASPRRGVPQGIAPHILLRAGRQALTELFEGLDERLSEVGGVRFDTGSDMATYRFGRRWPGHPTGMELLAVTRPQLEAVLRERVAALPTVTIRDQVAVSRLTGADGAVTGVVLDTGETLGTDLVIDCTGRGARSDRWLAALGVPAPEQVEIKVGVAYSSRFYRRRPGDLPGWQAAFTLPAGPQQRYLGVVLPVEGDRWLIGVGGWHVTEPPDDPESFEQCARNLPDPLVSEVIGRAEPIGDVLVARFPSSRRRLFEKLGRFPRGYLALGDAICSFNPVYGQGMTCAAREALVLRQVIEPREYYATAAEIIATPWSFAVGGDFVYPETSGPRPRGIRLRNWYSRQIAYASQIDAEVYRTFAAVQHLVTPPAVLFRPRVVARVLRLARKRRREKPAAG